jgi:putative ABC transport system permease protein
MKKLSYSLRYLIQNKGINSIKIVSLTLGLTAALVLFSQVAFDMSYDNFYPDRERIYSITCKWNMNGKESEDEWRIINAPFAPTMYREMPEVAFGTVAQNGMAEQTFLTDGERRVTGRRLIADSLFFRTFGLPVIAGNITDMGKPFRVFVSETFARRAFGEQDPLGMLLVEEENKYTVAGVFKDIPRNAHLRPDLVITFNTMYEWGARPGWQNNDNYLGYVKLAEGIDPGAVEAKIPEMMRRHFDVDAEIGKGIERVYFLRPVTRIHTGNPEVRKTGLILSLLAFSLLFAAAMNYVLLTVSGLPKRAKGIGVHKCNGATNRSIFRMLMTETSLLILVSLALSALIITAFRGYIEMIIKSDLSAVFAPSNLWVSGIVLLALLITTGVLPSRIFSSVPVTQVFRPFTGNRKVWKGGLLFVQFAGISFMLSLLAIIMMQYHMILNKDMGYEVGKILKSSTTKGMSNEQLELAKAELLRYPFVESVTLTTNTPLDRLNGMPVMSTETKENLFAGRFLLADADFVKTFTIPLKEGRTFRDLHSERTDEVIVNETLVHKLGIDDDPVGKQFDYFGETKTICGVMKDYRAGSVYEETFPIVVLPLKTYEWWRPNLAVRLNTPPAADLTGQLSETLKKLSNNEENTFVSFREEYNHYYYDARLFRDAVMAASCIMLLISLLGLFGFVEDEITRRTKEIAVRKVNGALAKDIVSLLAEGIAYIALPAIVFGLLISYVAGAEWLQQFTLKIPLHGTIFLLSGIAIFSIIQFCVIARSVPVATSNPVDYLKTE